MSTSNNFRRYIAFPFLVVFVMSMAVFGLTRTGQDNQNTGTMMGAKKPKKTTRRRKPATKPAADTTSTTENANTTGGTSTDLSGSYTGVVNYPDGSMSGPATLNISGNDFTLTPDGGSAVTGRITADTTRGYTGVTLQFGTFTPTVAGGTPSAAPTMISVHAKKTGNSLTLTSVEGEMHQFSFTPSGRRSAGKKK